MVDPLERAMDATKAATSNFSTPSSVTSAQVTTNAAQTKLDALAKYKDPELIKKEAEAKVMNLVSDKQQEILAQKDDIEKQVAEKIVLLTTLYLEFPPKLPAIDPKGLAKKAYQKTKKEMQELRQKVSKENLNEASRINSTQYSRNTKIITSK